MSVSPAASVEITDEQRDELVTRLEGRSAEDRLAWAVDRFGASLLCTSSFGPGSGALLHLWSVVAKGLPVHFIDTGFLFEETLAYRNELASALGLSVVVLAPETPRETFLAKHGLKIYQQNPDFCCAHNKVEPLQRALPGKLGWVSGLRRDQSSTRAHTAIVERTVEGPLKIHPIADWSSRDVYRYQEKHAIPEHPLWAKGYVSVGCEPCTQPVGADESDERAGRWAGSAKTECGIHTFLAKK